MVVGRNNGVVGLTGFSDEKMSGLLFGPQKSGRSNGVVLLTGWSYGGVPLYFESLHIIVSRLSRSLPQNSLMTEMVASWI